MILENYKTKYPENVVTVSLAMHNFLILNFLTLQSGIYPMGRISSLLHLFVQ
ncbi:hypothetical protein SAMN05428947_11931 [Mucilaginibacter sp. OK283]|nr:hypothetical protein SAMN05428947_11931 [Mucilaginibacter sp. OK283]